MSILDHKWGESVGADRVWSHVAGMRSDLVNRRVCVVLQAFIDESYQENREFVFGGFIARAENWAAFSPEWEACCREYGWLDRKTRKKYFHFRKMAQISEHRRNIPKFTKIVFKHALLAVSCRLHMGEFEAAKRRVYVPGVEIDFGDLEHIYRMAFRCLMDKFHNSRDAYSEVIGPDEKVDFFFDEQLHLRKLLQDAWVDYVGCRPETFRQLYGGMPRWEDDEEFPPLQAADLWAGAVRRAYRERRHIPFFNDGDDIIGSTKETGGGGFPILAIEFDEDDIVGAFLDMSREFYDGPVYDVQFKWPSQ